MNDFLSIEPVSTHNPGFLAIVDEHLTNGEVVVLLIRYPNSAGAKDYSLVRTRDDFVVLVEKLTPRTSITVFFESAFSIKGRMDVHLLEKTEKLFTEEYNAYEGLDIICLNPLLGEHNNRRIAFVQDINTLKEFFRLHDGHQVLVGAMKFWKANNKNFITAYVPDSNGEIRPGAY